MKKRSMLALASLATGFVVAAVTPSHATHHDVVGDPHVSGTLDSAHGAVAADGSAVDEEAPAHQ
ncbi:hypothetical protein ABZX30_16705 [Streptomyces sp. NPDC004542]|uniref:hypothetical protein n=1 Tax=Streptomyces sp. NPDC004542 TaxID=3154281 RepID=UPI0033B70CDE